MAQEIIKKRGKKILIIALVLIVVLALTATGFMYYNSKPSKTSNQKSSGTSGTPLKNPTAGLSLEQAVAQFDESFVKYLLIAIKANELHNPPLSSDTPRINFYIGEETFQSEISDGKISVSKGLAENEDIIIRTSPEEAVKMVQNKEYVSTSFRDGNSQIELVAGKLTLFAKGYLSLYEELTGESVSP